MFKVKVVIFILLILSTLLLLIYFLQEKLIFFPEKLTADHKFKFNYPFKEFNIQVDENIRLNGLLFQNVKSKGLVFYLHGNAGSIDSWAEVADLYINNGYDFFIFDYRGYGKSSGKISGEDQLYKDIQIVYDTLKKNYNEDKTIIIGYSIGTGMAANLASQNKPKMLILKAPYFNLIDLINHYFKIIPSFLIKYKFTTNVFLPKCQCPVILFHGNKDEIIPYNSSIKLYKLCKANDKLIVLKGEGHNGINENAEYITHLKTLLTSTTLN